MNAVSESSLERMMDAVRDNPERTVRLLLALAERLEDVAGYADPTVTCLLRDADRLLMEQRIKGAWAAEWTVEEILAREG